MIDATSAPLNSPIVITSADDIQVADYRELRFPDKRIAVERHGGFFIGEGNVVTRRIIDANVLPRSVLCTEPRYERNRDIFDALSAPIYVTTPDTLNEIVGFDLHRGIVCCVDRPAPLNAADLLADPTVRTVVALERINDFENLGSIFRSAVALGADAILLCPQCADPLYRRCVRVSLGNVVGIRYAVTDPWPQAIYAMNTTGFQTLALSPSGSLNLHSYQRAPATRIALLLGAEGPGLTDQSIAAATHTVSIPMHNIADSVNVGVAAAIALFAMAHC